MIKKDLNVSPLDFILQVTGSIENLMVFLQKNKINYIDFRNKKSFDIKYQSNSLVNYYRMNGITVASSNTLGDFNNDFSNDFFIL